MLPRDEQTAGKQAQANRDRAQDLSLLTLLPSATESLICGSIGARDRKSLLQTSRWGRDAVLREARSVTLKLLPSDLEAGRKLRPLARLLARACEAAEAGQLSLSLNASMAPRSKHSDVLAHLLAPAKQQGGWASVKELALKAFPASSTPVLKLVSTAFPALQYVTLSEVSVTHADLGSLSVYSQLSSLVLLSCEVQQTEASSTMSPLSALHSLRHLTVQNTTSSIVAGLTQLSGLSLGGEHATVAECVGHITGLTQLQSLRLGGSSDDLTSEDVESILTSLKQLTSLALNYSLNQAHFDALLTHAPQLTSFTCIHLRLEEDRSASPCSWTELVIFQVPTAWTLACLPTGSLTRLDFARSVVFPSPSPTLVFTPLYRVKADDMPGLVRRSLVNLTRCPAWQQCGPGVDVRLFWDQGNDVPQLVSLIRALAPLASKEVKLSIWFPTVFTGASEVQQLGVTLGSSLKQLVLEACRVGYDFWPAVWAHLPGLQQLTVTDIVFGSLGVDELSSFCSGATHPLQLNLGRDLYKEVGGKLDQEGRWMGASEVTVTMAVAK